MAILFGTDGWRAIIGADYSYDNVAKVLQAFCDLNAGARQQKVILGYDRRFCSDLFAREAASVLLGNDFQVSLSRSFCPTPCVSWMTKDRGALAGVVITASHNPFQWNGVKFKEGYGGSASPELTAKIEKKIIENERAGRAPIRISLETGLQQKNLEYFDPQQDYLKQLRSLVNFSAIRKAKLKIVFDPIYGAGSGFLGKLLGEQVFEIRGDANPGFGGVNPEPIEKNLKMLRETIRKRRAHVGLATDGDADRIGAMDEKGGFVDSHRIFSLLLRHLIAVKKWPGDVIKTVSTTQMIDRLADRYGLKVRETPIGFKYICQQFLASNSLMGGEESGGIGICRHVYERDGLLSGLLLLEIIAHHRKPLSKILVELQKEAGPLYFLREDIHLSVDRIERLKASLTEQPPVFDGFPLLRKNLLDGFKFQFEDGSWLLIRPSGTEPLLRVYAEAPSRRKARQLIMAAMRFIDIL